MTWLSKIFRSTSDKINLNEPDSIDNLIDRKNEELKLKKKPDEEYLNKVSTLKKELSYDSKSFEDRNISSTSNKILCNKEQKNDQSAINELVDEETDKSAKKKSKSCLDQPELFSYKSLNSPTEKEFELKIDNMSLDTIINNQQIQLKNEDCAINELIEGRMDLQVNVPGYLLKNENNNHSNVIVLINIERNTPMLDLLIKIGNKIKFNVNDYKIVVDKNLNYKASTAIGSLDVNQISIVPKTNSAIALNREKLQAKQNEFKEKSSTLTSTINKLVQNSTLNSQNNFSNNCSSNGNVPFQTTFRLQVNLPHNQRMVFRVTPSTKIREVKELVCEEKDLNFNKYQLVVFADLKQKQHPQVLELERTLAFYAVNEITLISNKNLEQMQIQNKFSGLHCQLNKIEENFKESFTNLNNIVNSQSTAASVPRKAIISLLEATNQLESNCDYSNNICTKNKCVCNSSSLIKNNQKNSSLCLNKIGRRKKTPAPPPPIVSEKNDINLKRSVSNNCINGNKKEEKKSKINSQLNVKQRHNSGSDSSGYHECLSSSNSPNNHFGGSLVNLSSNSLVASIVLQERFTSTPSDKLASSTNNIYHKKRKAPLPPVTNKSLNKLNEQNFENKIILEECEFDNKNKTLTTSCSFREKVNTKKLVKNLKNSVSVSNINQANNALNLELKKKFILKKAVKSDSFNSESYSSSGNSSSNSPEVPDEESLDTLKRKNYLTIPGCKENESDYGEVSLDNPVFDKIKNGISLNIDMKSPTSIASEPIYSTPRNYYDNNVTASQSTNSIVILSLDERPSSAPNCLTNEEDEQNNSKNRNNQTENSKDSGIFLKDNSITNKIDNTNQNITINLNETDELKDSEKKNVTTLIINVNNDNLNLINDTIDKKSISAILENNSIYENDGDKKNSKIILNQTVSSVNNIAPASFALEINKDISLNESIKSDKIKDLNVKNIDQNISVIKLDEKKNSNELVINEIEKSKNLIEQNKIEKIKNSIELPINKVEENKTISNYQNSRIFNIKEQLKQNSSANLNRPKMKLKNFKIGSYPVNTEQDIYNEVKLVNDPINDKSNIVKKELNDKNLNDKKHVDKNQIVKKQINMNQMIKKQDDVNQSIKKKNDENGINQNNKNELNNNKESTIQIADNKEGKIQLDDKNEGKNQLNEEKGTNQLENNEIELNKTEEKQFNPNKNDEKQLTISQNEKIIENDDKNLIRVESFKNNVLIKKPNLNAIKFNKVALNEGLDLLNETKKKNENLVDNQNFDSKNNVKDFSNFNYMSFDQTAQTLFKNLSMITPQPYKQNKNIIPRRLFFAKDSLVKQNDSSLSNENSTKIEDTNDTNKIRIENIKTKLDNSNYENVKNFFKQKKLNIMSKYISNEDKLQNTKSYLVSDSKKLIKSDSINNLNNKKTVKDTADQHEALLVEIRAFGGRNSLKKVQSIKDEKFEMKL